MSSAELKITPPDALSRLSLRLAAYQRVTGKPAAAILAQKGAQLVYGNADSRFGPTFPGLHRLFKKEIQPDGRIRAAARIRGFRLGRRQFGSEQPGISDTALTRAAALMGGHKSILIATNGAGEVTFLRTGVTGRRVRLRRGRKSFAVPGNLIGPLQQGEKRVNFRAVATIKELELREASRRYLGAAWLFGRWRRLAQSDPRRLSLGAFRYLANVNARAKLQLLSEAELRGDEETGNATFRLTSFVPGEAAIGSSRGLFSRALAAVAADLDLYLARHVRAAAVEAIKVA